MEHQKAAGTASKGTDSIPLEWYLERGVAKDPGEN